MERIRDLTFIPWRDILPIKNLFRKSKVWCPICFENSKNCRQPIYEPLIRNFKAVNICGIHSVRLETQCPNCNREVPFLSRKTRNGFCLNIIAENYASYQRMMKQKRIDEGCRKISEAVIKLYNSGVYPSRRKAGGFLLPQNILLREKAYQTVWKEALGC